VVSERITLSLIAGFAGGLVCVALDQSGAPADPPSRLETVLLLATLGGFALLGSWFRLCVAARADAPRPPAAGGAPPYARDGLAPVARRSRQRSR
jgi:hypothetical protein